GDRPAWTALDLAREAADDIAAQRFQLRHRQVQARLERGGVKCGEAEGRPSERAELPAEELLVEPGAARGREERPARDRDREAAGAPARLERRARRAAHVERERDALPRLLAEQPLGARADRRIARHPDA